MKNNSDRKIGNKITRAILLSVLASTIIIGLVGIISISIINGLSSTIYSDNIVPLSYVNKLQTDFLSMRVEIRDMALDKSGNFSSYIDQINSLSKDMTDQMNAYKSEVGSGNENANFQKMQVDVTKYNEVIGTLENDIQSGKLDQAVSLMNGEGTSITKQLDSEISYAFSFNTDMAKTRDQTSNTIFIIVIAAVVALIATLILLSIRFSKRIAQGISDPITKMVVAANSIANGNLNVDVAVDTRDETGILADAFKRIIESLRLLKTDVNMLVSDALEGRLETRADLSHHSGDYREIIEGVNKTLDTVKAPLDVASVFINKLADGEHQENIENTYKGYYAVLIENLNKVCKSVNILEDEAAKLADAGLNGNLEVRGDESKLKGAYAQIIRGVNQTFDSIKEPLDVASEFISNLADGKNQQDIENIYKGYYSSLVDNLNSVRKSLRILADESSKLTQAGLRGDFTVRGDVGVLKGGFAGIIDGFNKTIESIVVPLNESGVVLGKMAVNDYTVHMSDGYKGQLNEFAGSINDVREHLLHIEKLIAEVDNGSIESLDDLKKSGKRSENDKMTPSFISMMTTINNLISEANNLADAAVEGNLDVRGDAEKFQGGYRQIIEGMNKTMVAVEAPIEESSQVLQNLAQGNLTVAVTGEYKGEYNKIKTALNETIDAFNELLGNINIAASQVSVGSNQVSDASQSLSQGASEQASSVEELTASITEVAAQTKQNAMNASQANTLSSAVQTEADQGNEKMEQMLDSMREISESSSSISKIIKVIDDIAFQTNILALNAAVEAARAGQSGKGFAVVAEEVRNLAAKSAEAAKNTTALIEGSISKVESGTKIANETAGMLGKISEGIKKATVLVGNIASASNEQATAIAQIDKGISLVSTVVQTNSATAEESAASSEELSGQANMLMEMVGKFKLKKATSGISGDINDSSRKITNNTKLYPSDKDEGKHQISLTEKFGKY
jgi:methyl-accepting chemotaxis protein